MGGKTKQSQRTKNNVRPSSSGRSAELLSNVKLDTNLVNIGGGKVLPALFPTLVVASMDQGLNPEIQMCLKKLNKKDPITKSKALQELTDLVSNSKEDDVVAALPSWVHFYKILTADTDRKVREFTQMCHGAIMKACGRRAAPQLRALVPAWLQAQYDDHAPAHAHALHSLTSTFPDNKLPEVISFCKTEVMTHLLENLIGNVESALCKRIESPEEKELQKVRLVTSSLRGLEYFVRQLPPHAPLDEWLWAQLAPLLHAAAFWTFGDHRAHQLRAAWYCTVGVIVERFKGQFGATYGTKTLRLLVLAAKEARAHSAAPLWDCTLLFMHHVPDWHKYLDKKELFTKRILDVLEGGGWGDAKHLSNMLLPLLAHLPEDMLTRQFYEDFFNAIFIGLEKKSILSSKSERQSWITSLAECLRYLSVQNNDYVVEVATLIHRTWLERIFSPLYDPQIKVNLIKCSATNMASLIKYWLKQSKEENGEKYDQLARNFWQNVGSTVLTQIDKLSTDHEEIARLIDGHTLLIQTLKTSFGQEAKKKQSIKFDGDVQPDPEEISVPTQQCDTSTTERYKHNLNETVERICSQYFEFAEKKQVSSAVLTPLYTLIVDFDSKNLFMALARQFNTDSVYKFYDKSLRTWLSGDTMRCKVVADIVFLSIKYLSEQEKKCVFESFQQFPPPVVEWCISLSLSHPYCTAPSARDWLKGRVVEQSVRAVSRRAVADGDGLATNLLLMCLAHDCDGELAISAGAVAGIVQALSSALGGGAGAGAGGGSEREGASGSERERAARLAGALATALAASSAAAHMSDHYHTLLFNLLTLNMEVHRGSGDISAETWEEARAAWHDAAAALAAPQRDRFLRHAAQYMHTHLLNQTYDLNIPEIDHVVSLCPYLLNRRDDSDLSDDITQIISFTKLLFDAQSFDRKIVEKYALRYDCVTCNLNCPFDDDNDVIKAVVEESADSELSELTKEDFIAYANEYIFRATYLKAILLHKLGDDEDEEQKSWCNILLDDQYVQTAFCQVLYDYVVVCSLHDGYAFWPHYNFIQKTKQKLDALLEDIIKETAPEMRIKMSAILSELAATKGYYWSYAMKYYEVKTKCEGDSSESEFEKTEETLDTINLQEILTGNGFFHSLQANDKWCPNEQSSYRTKYLIMLRSIYVAHASDSGVLDDQLVGDLARGQNECNLDVVVNLYYRHNDTMLYERDISAAPWRQVVSNAAIVEFLRAAVDRAGWDLPAHHWDFITITLCSILTSIGKSTQTAASTKVCLLAISALRLYASVHRFVGSVRSESERRQPSAHVAHLPTEWADMFAPDLAANILLLLLTHLKRHSCQLTSPSSQLIGAVMSSIKLVSWATAPASLRLGALSERCVATHCATVLSAPAHPFYKYLAFNALKMMAEPLVLHDAEKLAMWTSDSDDSLGEGDDVKQRPELSLEFFHQAYKHLEEIVDTALTHIRVAEETCEMVPFTDSYSMSLGWLLLVVALAETAELARGDLVHHYIQIYREKEYAEKALLACLRLLPPDVFQFARDASLPPPPRAADNFLTLPDLSVNAAPVSGTLPRVSCRGVYWCVCGAGGGAARGWRGAASPREARALGRLVRAYVSPHLVRDQLNNVHARAHELDDAQVTVLWSSQEVSCVYQVEERSVELRVWLSREHPLSLPRVATPPPAPAALHDTHWVAVYLAYQRGTLLNALKMWMSAVSARLDAAPQCYICYCRLHPDTGHLPRVLCRQCRNRFHNSCLRKWFTTSNKSNCPLCRAVF